MYNMFYSYEFVHEHLCIGYLPMFKFNPVVKFITSVCVCTVQCGMLVRNVYIARENRGLSRNKLRVVKCVYMV